MKSLPVFPFRGNTDLVFPFFSSSEALASPPLRLNQILDGLDEAREEISTAFQDR